MRKELYIKVAAFLIIGLFMVSMVGGVVSAENNNKEESKDKIWGGFDPIKDLFTGWDVEGVTSQNIAKYLFIILAILLVYSVLDITGLIPSSLIKWPISIIVGILAVGYLTPNEVFAVLSSYNALGMTLLFFFPFLILIFFTIRMEAHGGAQGVVFQYLMWIVFFIFLIYRFIWGMVGGQLNTSDPTTWIFVFILILTAVVVFGNKKIRSWLGGQFLGAQVRAARSTLEKAIELRKMESEGLENQGEG